MARILFVCTGNTCRSPMAEAILKASLEGKDRECIEVASAGTAASEGRPASENAVKVLAEKGISLGRHSSRRLTCAMMMDADLVVAMSLEHLEEIAGICPEASSKVVILGELDHGRGSPDIADPQGGDEARYSATRDEIKRLVDLLIPYLKKRFGGWDR